MSSASGATAYYTAGSYYTQGESQSQWGGGAREAAGISDGPVDPIEFENILNGLSADGVPLTKHNASGKARQVGIDATFSPGKTVSILAQGVYGDKIREVIWTANKAGMGFLGKNFAQIRLTDPKTGKRIYKSDQKIVYASFMEKVSRANDPSLHIHNPLPNLVLDDNGKFHAMHNTMILRNIKLIGAVFRAEVAKGMRELGVNLESAGKHGLFEVTNVSPEVKKLFSKRREQMEGMLKDSMVKERAMDRIALISRPNKDHLSPAELLVQWSDELATIGTSFEQITRDAFNVNPERTQSPTQVLNTVISDLSESQRTWTEIDVLRSALMDGVPQVTAAELQTEMQSRVKAGTLVKDGKDFTTPQILRREAAVIKQMKNGRLRGEVVAEVVPPNTDPNALKLTQGQQKAGNLIVSSRDKIIGIQGDAGVGKTTMLKAAIPLAKDAGLKVIGIAPTSTAVEALEETGVFDKVMTSQQFCLTPRGDNQTLLVVDEASMLGTKSMLNILQYANSKEMAKVVLMGDVNQHGAIEAGAPFADMQRAGLQTAKIDQIVRQKDARHRGGIAQLAKGNIRAGFKAFAPEIHQVNRETMNQHAVDLWQASDNSKTPIIVQTNRHKAEINAAIKSSLGQEGPGRDHTIWRQIHAKPSQKMLARTYKDASHIRIGRDFKRAGLRRGEIYKIEAVDEKRSRVTLSSNGKTKTFKPAKRKLHKDTVQMYQQDIIKLHAKDRVRFTRGGKDRKVNNNDRGTIKSIGEKTVTLVLDKGKTLTLPVNAPELRHMDHGWALTGYSVQGKTENSAIVVMPSHASPLTTLESLYVGMSRHKETVALVTDNADRLKLNLEHALDMKTDRMNVHKGPLQKPQPKRDRPPGHRHQMTLHKAKDDHHPLEKRLGTTKPQQPDRVRTRSNDRGR